MNLDVTKISGMACLVKGEVTRMSEPENYKGRVSQTCDISYSGGKVFCSVSGDVLKTKALKDKQVIVLQGAPKVGKKGGLFLADCELLAVL